MRIGKRAQRGLTLAEILVASAILLGSAGALLTVLTSSPAQAGYLGQLQVALSAAQGQLEELMATPFTTLATIPALTSQAIPELSDGRLAIRIRPSTPGNPLGSDFLDVVVSACWRDGRRMIGEDRNCNGAMDPNEDLNLNGWLDSPAMVSTRMARTEN